MDIRCFLINQLLIYGSITLSNSDILLFRTADCAGLNYQMKAWLYKRWAYLPLPTSMHWEVMRKRLMGRGTLWGSVTRPSEEKNVQWKKEQAPKSGLPYPDRSENLINQKSVKFYIDIDIQKVSRIFLSWKKCFRKIYNVEIFEKYQKHKNFQRDILKFPLKLFDVSENLWFFLKIFTPPFFLKCFLNIFSSRQKFGEHFLISISM